MTPRTCWDNESVIKLDTENLNKYMGGRRRKKAKKLLDFHRNHRIYTFRLQYHSCEERWRES